MHVAPAKPQKYAPVSAWRTHCAPVGLTPSPCVPAALPVASPGATSLASAHSEASEGARGGRAKEGARQLGSSEVGTRSERGRRTSAEGAVCVDDRAREAAVPERHARGRLGGGEAGEGRERRNGERRAHGARRRGSKVKRVWVADARGGRSAEKEDRKDEEHEQE